MIINLINTTVLDSQSDLNEGWIWRGERHLWHVNDSLGAPKAEDDGKAGTALSAAAAAAVVATAAALVGEGDFSALLIFDIYAFCFCSVISLLTLGEITEIETSFRSKYNIFECIFDFF